MAAGVAEEETPRRVRWLLIGMLALALAVEESMDLRRGSSADERYGLVKISPKLAPKLAAKAPAQSRAHAGGQCHAGALDCPVLRSEGQGACRVQPARCPLPMSAGLFRLRFTDIHPCFRVSGSSAISSVKGLFVCHALTCCGAVRSCCCGAAVCPGTAHCEEWCKKHKENGVDTQWEVRCARTNDCGGCPQCTGKERTRTRARTRTRTRAAHALAKGHTAAVAVLSSGCQLSTQLSTQLSLSR